MKSGIAIDALSALAHEGRLNAFRLLVKTGPDGMAAGDIARKLEIPPNSLSTSLNILHHAGLVESRRDGRSIIYSACYEQMTNLLSYLMEDCCNGDPEICAPLVQVVACCVPKSLRIKT